MGHVFIGQEGPRRAKKGQEGYPRLGSGGISRKEVNRVSVMILKKKASAVVCGGLE